jgi:hypothetical protein
LAVVVNNEIFILKEENGKFSSNTLWITSETDFIQSSEPGIPGTQQTFRSYRIHSYKADLPDSLRG